MRGGHPDGSAPVQATLGIRVDTARRRASAADAPVEVVHRGRRVGLFSREVLERAAEFGLGLRSLRDIWVDPAPSAPPDAPASATVPASEPARGLALAVARAAASEGCRAWLVGGPVRDLLLGRPLGDLDVAVDRRASAVARRLAREGRGRVRVHRTFGTASVVWLDGRSVDLAELRHERYARPAALPTVAPADLRTDLARRDFTINAWALRLTVRGTGSLTAAPGAHADLRDGVLRVLHGLSFVEDPTRAFRAARFAGRLGFRPSPGTARLIRVARSLELFAALSSARVRRELEALLDERPVAGGLRWLRRLGLDTVLHPELRLDAARVAAASRVEAAHEALDARSEVRRRDVLLAALFDGLRAPARRALIERLAPNRLTRRVLEHAPEGRRRVQRALAGGSLTDGRLHAICAAEVPETLLLAAGLAADPRVGARVHRYLCALRGARADIDGHDLLCAGAAAGPELARGLAAALRAKLDGRAPSREAQLRVALRVLGNA